MNEFFDRNKMTVPGISEIPTRISRNLSYFQTNYVIVLLILAIYSALTSPMFLLTLGIVVFMWMSAFKQKSQPVMIAGIHLTERSLTLILLLVTGFLFYVSSIGAILFWLLCASSVVIIGHSIMYTPNPVDEFGFGLAYNEGVAPLPI
eukprot:TRINITY_DN1630_c0_g1_i2.p1 TRINITY_DN1630_c0_g1~~TRINITY_DN1630_c0_g1_i2.p1  ORF type:complete len:148 (-),score=6.17 TRINITY_DN1630_c0_g1_i2:61-504(-)